MEEIERRVITDVKTTETKISSEEDEIGESGTRVESHSYTRNAGGAVGYGGGASGYAYSSGYAGVSWGGGGGKVRLPTER